MMRDWMRWDPFAEIGSLVLPPTERGVFVPDVDIQETPSAYVFKADLPGMKEKDVEVSMSGNRLTVSGKRETEKKDENERYYLYERSYGSFSRSLQLPEGIDSDAIKANLANGVLRVTVPKPAPAQVKKVEVKSAA